MSLYVCSLGFKPPAGQEQVIPPGGGYTLLRLPFGTQENADPWDMHSRARDGRAIAYADPDSGLIHPAVAGWGTLELNIIWLDGDYTELRDVFVRDPLGAAPDPTAYAHRARTPGENCFDKVHGLLVRPGVPLGVQVAHDGPSAAKVRMIQFKLAIQDDVALPAVDRAKLRPGAVDPWPDM